MQNIKVQIKHGRGWVTISEGNWDSWVSASRWAHQGIDREYRILVNKLVVKHQPAIN